MMSNDLFTICFRSISIGDILSSEVKNTKQQPSAIHIHYIQKSQKDLWKAVTLILHHSQPEVCLKWSQQIEEFISHLGMVPPNHPDCSFNSYQFGDTGRRETGNLGKV